MPAVPLPHGERYGSICAGLGVSLSGGGRDIYACAGSSEECAAEECLLADRKQSA